jgi:1-acyl-sn-glycerol-3-phosphate acyltransferase
MADLIEFPRRAASAAGQVVTEPMRLWPVHSVDDYGRDPHLVSLLSPLARLRWDVGVSGIEHLPKKGGALLVCNSRRFALAAVYAAWALGEATGRPVRFVGRPDVAPVGAFMRRIGGLLDRPDEVRGALRNHELVIISAAGTNHSRHAGAVPHELVGAAVVTGSPVFPVATMSNAVGRTARAEVGAQVRPRRSRRGPLSEVELAEQVQHHLQRMLDGFGGVHTGVAPIDWLAEG